MSIAIQKDFLELQGFTYSENTFNDVFLQKWNGQAPNLDQSASSSDGDESKIGGSEEPSAGGNTWGDELESVVGNAFGKDNQSEMIKGSDDEEESKVEPEA